MNKINTIQYYGCTATKAEFDQDHTEASQLGCFEDARTKYELEEMKGLAQTEHLRLAAVNAD